MKLFKTTIIIWSDYDTTEVELSDLFREADQGDAYCSYEQSELIEHPETDPHWDGTEFFGVGDKEEEEFFGVNDEEDNHGSPL